MTTSTRQERMRFAVDAVREGMRERRASEMYNVPRTSLRSVLQGKRPITTAIKTNLTVVEERRFSQWAINRARSGFNVDKKVFLQTITDYLENLKEKEPRFINNNRPGKSWYYAYLKRHPELKERKVDSLGVEKVFLTSFKFESWFDGLDNFMAACGDPDLLQDPGRIFNADGIGFPLSSNDEVMAPNSRRDEDGNHTKTSRYRAQITAMCCVSASGEFTHPMVIMPKLNNLDDTEEEFGVNTSVKTETKKGWMTKDLFAEWLQDIFITMLEDRSIKRPVLLLINGSSIHKSKETESICMEQGVMLYSFHPDANQLIQPLDQSFHSSLRQNWSDAVFAFQTSNPDTLVTRENFGLVFGDAYSKSCNAHEARQGFERSGLYPFRKNFVFENNRMGPFSHFDFQRPTFSETSLLSSSSSSQHSTSFLTFTAPVPSPLTTLAVLEHILPEEMKSKFNARLEEGVHVNDDYLYNTWKDCKLLLSVTPSYLTTPIRQEKRLEFLKTPS